MTHSHGCWLDALVPFWLLAGGLSPLSCGLSIELLEWPQQMEADFPRVSLPSLESDELSFPKYSVGSPWPALLGVGGDYIGHE